MSDAGAFERLRQLCEVVEAEIRHLALTDRGLFGRRFTPERAMALSGNNAEAERVDAFAARFGRLQDTTGDKLLPALLRLAGQSPGPAIDNLNLAEKWGWIGSVQDWLGMRALRNKMVHEYIKDPAVLSDALNAAHDQVPALVDSAQRLVQETGRRLAAAAAGGAI